MGRQVKENNVPVYGTALENGVPYGEVTPAGSFALIVGNEGNGVRQEILAKRIETCIFRFTAGQNH